MTTRKQRITKPITKINKNITDLESIRKDMNKSNNEVFNQGNKPILTP